MFAAKATLLGLFFLSNRLNGSCLLLQQQDAKFVGQKPQKSNDRHFGTPTKLVGTSSDQSHETPKNGIPVITSCIICSCAHTHGKAKVDW